MNVTKRNPNPSPTGFGFGFLLFGAGNRGRTFCPADDRFALLLQKKRKRFFVVSFSPYYLKPKQAPAGACFGLVRVTGVEPARINTRS